LLNGPLEGFKVRSAGDAPSFGFDANYIGGRSPTLDIDSHEDDAKIIQMHDYGSAY
jgi:hypothetical protein